MARGDIFCIKDEERKGSISFDEEQYYDKLETLGIDYVQNKDGDEAAVSIDCLKDTLKGLGAEIHDNVEYPFAFAFRFGAVEHMLSTYFKPRLEKLKAEVEKLTLFDITKLSVPSFDHIINDDYDDMVTLMEERAESTMTLDMFLRQIRPGITYYVHSRIILMH